MAKTNSGLVAYAKAQVGKPYWYGTFGQLGSAALYKSKKAQYPSYYTASDFTSQYGQRVHDCIGLVKGYLWSSTATATPVYNGSQDWGAKTTYSKATTKGKAATFPKTAGLLVFKGTSASAIHHVGVYGGDGYVYEAKGHAYGVVKTKYKSSDWPFWAQHPLITDDTAGTTTTSTASASTTSATTSATTSSTTTASTSSSSSSSASLTVDGTWGQKTTKAMQKALGTTVDGIVSNQLTSCKKYLEAASTASWAFYSSKRGGSPMVKALQKLVGATQDGYAGQATVKALQKWLNSKASAGLTVDGYMGAKTVKAVQKALNNGKF